MRKSIPLFWRFLGLIRTEIDNYSFSKRWFKKNKKEPVFFVQIGANDGISQDPIYQYSNNWSGVLVEPLPKIFTLLKKNYSNHKGKYIFENSAISNYNGELALFIPKNYENNEWQTKIASVNKDIGMLRDYELQEIIVSCITLNELINRYNIKHIDLLILDVEGYEMNILNSFDFLILPQAIYFETRFYCYDDLVKIYEKFGKLGYRIFPEKDNIFMVLNYNKQKYYS